MKQWLGILGLSMTIFIFNFGQLQEQTCMRSHVFFRNCIPHLRQ